MNTIAKPFAKLTEVGQARRLKLLAIEALAAYDLEWTDLRLLSNGWNCVFRLETAAGPLVLRITRPVPGAIDRSVGSEVEFMTALAKATDIGVPPVIPNRHGALVTMAGAPNVPEARECVVFGWLDGRNLASRTEPGTWTALGELMGRMHRFSETWTPSASFTTPVFDSIMPYGEPLVVFEPGRVELYGLEGLLREATVAVGAHIAAIGREDRRIVVHADLHQWNVKIMRDVLSPFDFEDILWAAPVLDVSTSLYYIRDRDDYPDLARAFKAGYERHRPWVEHEPGDIDRLLFARALLLLNAVALDEGFDVGDLEAFVRRRERYAKLALGQTEPLLL